MPHGLELALALAHGLKLALLEKTLQGLLETLQESFPARLTVPRPIQYRGNVYKTGQPRFGNFQASIQGLPLEKLGDVGYQLPHTFRH